MGLLSVSQVALFSEAPEALTILYQAGIDLVIMGCKHDHWPKHFRADGHPIVVIQACKHAWHIVACRDPCLPSSQWLGLHQIPSSPEPPYTRTFQCRQRGHGCVLSRVCGPWTSWQPSMVQCTWKPKPKEISSKLTQHWMYLKWN